MTVTFAPAGELDVSHTATAGELDVSHTATAGETSRKEQRVLILSIPFVSPALPINGTASVEHKIKVNSKI